MLLLIKSKIYFKIREKIGNHDLFRLQLQTRPAPPRPTKLRPTPFKLTRACPARPDPPRPAKKTRKNPPLPISA